MKQGWALVAQGVRIAKRQFRLENLSCLSDEYPRLESVCPAAATQGQRPFARDWGGVAVERDIRKVHR